MDDGHLPDSRDVTPEPSASAIHLFCMSDGQLAIEKTGSAIMHQRPVCPAVGILKDGTGQVEHLNAAPHSWMHTNADGLVWSIAAEVG